MALPRSSRNGKRPKWVALHSAEGARRKQDLYAFFDRNQNASSHVGIDGGGFDDWIDSAYAAWTLLNGNPISVNGELCAFARWTRAQWLSTGVVDGVVNPRGMVRAAARWAKRECERWGIPKRHIGVAGVARGEAGIIIHWDYSRGTGDGDHWDTGEHFPLDVFFADMEDDVTANDNWHGIRFGTDASYSATPAEWLLGTNNHAHAMRFTDLPAIKTMVAQILAAVTEDSGITPEFVQATMREAALDAAREQAPEVARLINADVVEAVKQAAGVIRDSDNIDEARETVDELLRRISTLMPATPGLN